MEFHEIANIFPLLKDDELADLAQDIKANGLLQPIVTYQGKILDGRNRYNACLMVGVYPEFDELNEDITAPLDYVIALNLKRRHLDESQRGMIAAKIETYKQGRPGKDANLHDKISREQAAEMLNVSPRTVASAAKVLDDGIPELIEAVEGGDISVSAAAEIAKLPQEEQQERILKPHVSHNAGDNEWYTPEDIIESARYVLTTIDLDPASSALANDVVKASRYFTSEDDGLKQEWHGRVWLNPPYAQPLISQFCENLIHHFENGDIERAIVLVNNATETNWCQAIIERASAVCFPKGRIRFWHPDKVSTPLQGQLIAYLGEYPSIFTDNFSLFGKVLVKPNDEN